MNVDLFLQLITVNDLFCDQLSYNYKNSYTMFAAHKIYRFRNKTDIRVRKYGKKRT